MRSFLNGSLRAPDGGAASASDIDQLCINTIRTLAIDGVQKANSGHPGTPMGLAPATYTLWQNLLKYDPADPLWPGRDRFVLSGGHASMLLYSVIYLTGIHNVTHEGKVQNEPALTIQDLESFRQYNSKTPGHPEYRHTAGVETTTGPLGQGCANSVGMAMAQLWLATHYNKPNFPLFDYNVYAFCGDGDMMEGVVSEAASLAGHLKLGNLIWLYDRNKISIEGSTDLAFTEDVGKRFEAYGWQVLEVKDANNIADIKAKLEEGRKETQRPTLIIQHSVIGFGSPHKAGKASAHGEPLGVDEVAETKKNLGFPADKTFYVPDGVLEHFKKGVGARGAAARKKWYELFEAYKKEFPELGQQVEDIIHHRLPKGWDKDIPVFETDEKGVASRASSGKVLNAIAKNYPWLIGGAADLAPSTKTDLTFEGAGSFQPKEWNGTYGGRNLHFGVREHAMGSIANGLTVSGVRAYCSGFFIFSDYMKPPIRLSALMGLPVIYIFTHDSIGVGEDGPTHQPIEQLIQFRATPGLITLRPGDANEVAEAWRVTVTQQHKPVCLVLSRQEQPTLDRKKYASASGVAKGAYVLADSNGKPDVILIATGTELGLAVKAYEKLTQEGIKVRVVSMPSWDLFEAQPQSYRESVLPPDVKGRVVVEMASAIGWERYAGTTGAIIAMHGFGASAPLKNLLPHFGFTEEAVLKAAREQAKKA
ncbi:transketolase [Entomobacter blattae]|uniref:Transketolase n=1 Tax=Entomobacter blattae TaxID=2762277 RepID=A0A7H1NNX2_9PROT|nr:transketolase [Entomobacter blattae]QNT77482.1 Transketolase [Entomobacter blattae]